MKTRLQILLQMMVFALSIYACGKKSSSSSAASPTVGSLALAYPSTLAVSSPTTTKSTSLALDDANSKSQLELADAKISTVTAPPPLNQAIAQNKAFIQGTTASACQPNLMVLQLTQPPCFAQEVTATPDPSSSTPIASSSPLIFFAPDIANINTAPQGVSSSTKTATELHIRPGDGGIIESTDSAGNACIATAASYYIGTVQDYVQRALALVGAALCAGQLQGIGLPTGGATTDLSSAISSVWQLPSGFSVSKATITDESSGTTTSYETIITIEFPDPSGNKRTTGVDLVNNPTTSETSKYEGRLLMQETQGKDPTLGTIDTSVVTIGYNSTASTLTFQSKSADFHSGNNPADYIDSTTGYLDFTKFPAPDASKNPTTDQIAANVVQTNFSLNKDESSGTPDGTGTFVYSWLAGALDIAARAFLVTVTKDSSGNLNGVGLVGYAETPITGDATKLVGFYPAWAQTTTDDTSPNLASTFIPFAQQQNFTKTASGSIWTLTTDDTHFTVSPDGGQAAQAANTDSSLVYFSLAPIVGATGGINGLVPPAITPPQIGTAIPKVVTGIGQ